ncbi:MAG TPA: hypothetical protein VFV36_10285 [Candidatus Methylomirabilis sp.]|nr:hypothetical protein [Candidatus Methylomirabilis sp.]
MTADPLLSRLLELEEELHRGGWHAQGEAHPTLYLLRGGELEAEEVVLPEGIWSSGLPPGLSLRVLAGAVRAVGSLLGDHRDVRAVVLAFEAWSLTVEAASAELARALAAAHARAVHEHADRVELRLACGVRGDGTMVVVQRLRGGEPEEMSGGLIEESAIWDGLREILGALGVAGEPGHEPLEESETEREVSG